LTAAVGWWREKKDIQLIREHFREREAAIRAAISEVDEGVPLARFKELFPDAPYDQEDQEWVVSIPTGYDENPACSNVFRENKYFTLSGEVVRPVPLKRGGGVSHGDRFGSGGAWYYFWRAWYSSSEEHLESRPTPK